jgi:hypothetical protein
MSLDASGLTALVSLVMNRLVSVSDGKARFEKIGGVACQPLGG